MQAATFHKVLYRHACSDSILEKCCCKEDFMEQFAVLAKVAVMPGKLEELRQLFKNFFQEIGQEPGLEFRHLMLDKDDHSRIFIYEVWRSQKDFENHLTNLYSKKFMEDIQGTYTTEGFIKYLTPLI